MLLLLRWAHLQKTHRRLSPPCSASPFLAPRLQSPKLKCTIGHRPSHSKPRGAGEVAARTVLLVFFTRSLSNHNTYVVISIRLRYDKTLLTRSVSLCALGAQPLMHRGVSPSLRPATLSLSTLSSSLPSLQLLAARSGWPITRPQATDRCPSAHSRPAPVARTQM